MRFRLSRSRSLHRKGRSLTKRRPRFGRVRGPGLLPALGIALLLGALASNGAGQAARLHGDLAPARDLAEVLARDTLTVLVGLDAQGAPLAYEAGLADALARELDVVPEVVTAASEYEMMRSLHAGEADLVAADLMQRPADWPDLAFVGAHTMQQMVIVQPLPDGWEIMAPSDRDRVLVRRPADLSDRRIVVPAGCACLPDLERIAAGPAPGLEIEQIEGADQAALVAEVARGAAPLTVAYESIAVVAASFERTLDTRTALFELEGSGFVVRREAAALQDTLQTLAEALRDGPEQRALFAAHFRSPRGNTPEVRRYERFRDRLAPYAHIVREGAEEVGWDWTLLAAQMYQESQFDAGATSFAGARGLMQVMPATGRWLGFRGDLYDPETNMAAATRFIEYLKDFWSDRIDGASDYDRLAFLLASYNAGPGHVEDARRLAAHYGANPDRWVEVRPWLLRKAEERYYTHPVVRHGYCRGTEPVAYVDLILERERSYRRLMARATLAERTTPLVTAPGVGQPAARPFVSARPAASRRDRG